MKSLIVKTIFILMLSIGLYSTSSAHGYYHYRSHYCSPRAYYGPRVYYAPHYYYHGPEAYYRPVFIPGHWAIDRFGVRVWIRPHCG